MQKIINKIATVIVKYCLVWTVVFSVLAIVSIFTMTLVRQNYDMTKYLPDTTETILGLEVMENEFGLSNNVLVMVDMPSSRVPEMKSRLSAVNGVQLVTLDSMKDGKALFLVTVSGDEYASTAKTAVEDIKAALSGESYQIAGSAVSSMELERSIKTEIPIILVIAIVIIFLVLLVTSHSWLEPLIFGIVLLVSVLINMGSNVIFGEISYITFAVSAILQIALAMDYSIILLHGFIERKAKGLSDKEALIDSLAYNLRPISSSGLTTIAGLIALLFMTFSIGFDIGIVLAKGILISLFTVILFMPSIIMIFAKPIQKTMHKPLPLEKGGVAKLSISLRAVLPLIMILVIAGSYMLQLGNVYTFSGWEDTDGSRAIEKQFGDVNQAVLIIGNDYADDKDAQTKFINSIRALQNDDGAPAIKSVNAWTNLQLTADSLSGSIDIDLRQYEKYISAFLGDDPTVADIQRIWQDCGGNIYDIEVPKAAVAMLLERDPSDNMVNNVYNILKGSNEKLTVGVMLDLIASENSLLSEYIPANFVSIAATLNSQKDVISVSGKNVLTPIIDELDEKYGANTSIYDISFVSDPEGFVTLCTVLFGKETFDVFEFANMWQDAGGKVMDFVITPAMVSHVIQNLTGFAIPEQALTFVLSAVSQDGKVTVEEFLKFMSDNRDREIIKTAFSPQLIGTCVLLYELRDMYSPIINPKIDELLATLRATFVGENHTRIIMLMDLPKDSDTTFSAIDTVKLYANRYFGEDNFFAGESMTVKDISDAFSSDLVKINLVTVLSIVLILAILFRSIVLPFILVIMIQGAIWITMAITTVAGTPIFFMSYIICICIQMGATIDYAIVIASNYRRNRATMDKRDAVVAAVKAAMPTILTSGLILTSASFIIGYVSSVMPIYSIGRLLGLGTIISILLILFLLPSVLYIFDGMISTLTWDGVKAVKSERPVSKRKQRKLALATAGAEGDNGESGAESSGVERYNVEYEDYDNSDRYDEADGYDEADRYDEADGYDESEQYTTEELTEQPSEEFIEEPAEEPEQPNEEPNEEPTEIPEEPTAQPYEEPNKKPEEPTDELMEEPAEEPEQPNEEPNEEPENSTEQDN